MSVKNIKTRNINKLSSPQLGQFNLSTGPSLLLTKTMKTYW